MSAVAQVGSSGQQKKKLLVDALLLALRNSEVARVVDMGTLEYFLDSSYLQMVRGDSIDLAKLWDVLEKEPGIEPRMVYPPLLAYKSWERRLGVTVFLPGVVKALPAEERKAHESRCPIKEEQLEGLLTQRKLTAPKPPHKVSPAVLHAVKSKPAKRTRRLLPVAILGVVGLTLAVGIGTWIVLTPRAPTKVEMSSISGELSLRDGRQSGESLRAVIADPNFGAMPVEERTKRVAAVFTAAKRQGIRSMLLVDEKGAVMASAQAGAGTQPDQIAVAP